jgi:hypothetical protein
MRYLPAVLAFVACSSVATGSPEEPKQRDGTWLQHGIRQYERLTAGETLSVEDANAGRYARSYVCAVLDLEKYLVQRADLLAAALEEGKKKKHHINPQIIEGMSRAMPIMVPLMNTDFFTDSPSCDRTVVIVRDFLEKYPEVLDSEADSVIEKALLDAYTKPPPEGDLAPGPR